MAESSLLNIISEKIVKPSSSTPPSSRYYKINALDAQLGQWLLNFAFLYPKERFHGGKASKREELFEVLETSLSKTLTYYYPFAGRFMDDNITIDCNDAGVQLWHIQVRGSMSEILNNRVDYTPWNSVFLPKKYRCVSSLIMIQLNYFECGGIGIVISMSHKLGDGTTLANFLNDWAAIPRGSQDAQPPAPLFLGASIIPPPPSGPINTPTYDSSNLVTQRFVLSTSSIFELKRKVIIETEIENPSQVEVVTALIFERLNLMGSFRPSLLMQMVNFRPIPIPPLSEQMVGSFGDKYTITVEDEKEMKFLKIITELRKSKMEYMNTRRVCVSEFVNRYTQFWIEDAKKLKMNNFDLYAFSSMFRMPYYEVDFGFGNPIFVCQAVGELERTIHLMPNPNGDGIDAIVTLKRDQMSIFEQDEKLLAFASINPLICTLN